MLKIMSSGNCKIKQWNTATHLLEWLKCKTLTTQNAGNLFTDGRNKTKQKNGTATLEVSLAVS